MNRFTFRLSPIFAVLAFAAIASAQAQDAPAPAAQQAAKPTDQKAFSDWSVRCFPISSPSPCEMIEQLDQKTTGKRLMSISIGYAPKTDRHIIQIALPLGVSFAKGVKIVADAYKSPAIQYRRCDRGGCYVEGFIDNAAIDALGRSSASAKMMIASADGRDISLPLSLNGFSQAHDALKSLAKEKVGSAPAAAPAPAQ